MKVYLCGQRSFGEAALAMLIGSGHEVAGVSAPTEVEGRPDRLWLAAEAAGLRRLPAGSLDADSLPTGVDLIVCAHSHDFVGRKTRLRARYGALGYHPSLLPIHRGRDAVIWTVRMGDRVTGGTVYWLSDTVDGGPVAAQRWCFVRPGESASDLWRRALFPMGIEMLRDAVRDVAAGRIVAVPQDEKLATWEPSFGRQPLRRPDVPLLCARNDDQTVRYVVE